MPLIAEAYAGRVEMLNAIFGGGESKSADKPGSTTKGRGKPHTPAQLAAALDAMVVTAKTRRGG